MAANQPDLEAGQGMRECHEIDRNELLRSVHLAFNYNIVF